MGGWGGRFVSTSKGEKIFNNNWDFVCVCVCVWEGGGGSGYGCWSRLSCFRSVLAICLAVFYVSVCFIASFGSLSGLPAFSSVPAKSVLSCYLRGMFNETVTRISA